MLEYIIFFSIISISYILSYKINLNLNNYDIPGYNKSHKKKVITSGGLIPLISISLIILYLIFFREYESIFFNSIPQIWLAPICIMIFTLLSFLDDLNYVPFQIRLITQIIIVYFCISLIPVNYEFNFQTPIFGGYIPVKIDVIATILFWTFLINSTNFIDGFDGMFSFQISTNFFGLSVIFFILGENFHFTISLLMFFLGIIFIPFNFSKKYKLFLGDAGSIPSGFILGWMLISLINMDYIISAILLNIIFILDISYTLLLRILSKKSIFKRHNDFVFKKIILKSGPRKYFINSIFIQIILVILSITLVVF